MPNEARQPEADGKIVEGRIRIVCTTAARLSPQSRPRHVRPCQGDTPWTPQGRHDLIRIESRRFHDHGRVKKQLTTENNQVSWNKIFNIGMTRFFFASLRGC